MLSRSCALWRGNRRRKKISINSSNATTYSATIIITTTTTAKSMIEVKKKNNLNVNIFIFNDDANNSNTFVATTVKGIELYKMGILQKAICLAQTAKLIKLQVAQTDIAIASELLVEKQNKQCYL